MNPQDYSRRVAYRPPSAWYRRLNNTLGVFLTSLGLAPQDVVTLEVPGRTSGKPRRTPILQTRVQGDDYLVALAGESEWVRNVRASGGRALIRRRSARPVRLVEIPASDGAPVISEYIQRGTERGGSKAAATQARFYFGLDPDPSLEEIRAVADHYPVFRIVYGASEAEKASEEATDFRHGPTPDIDPPRHRFTSLKNLAAVCGGLAGLGGLTHGIGEMLQGSRSPGGIVFDSWAEGRIATNLGGEPAMSLIPSLFFTGILTIVASTAVLIWAGAFLDRPRAGTGLVVLSAVMLLVGGGFGPPVLGMLAGLVAGGAHARPRRWASRLAGRSSQLLASLWPALFWLCALNALFLVVGSLVLAGAFDVAAPILFVYSLFLAVVSMPLATLAGIARTVRGIRVPAHVEASLSGS